MEAWTIWLIIAVAGFVVGAVFGIIAIKSYDHGKLFDWITAIGFIVFLGAIITAIVFGIQTSIEQRDKLAAEQGLTVVSSTSEQSYYLVTVDGTCTISADQVDGKFVVVGSDPAIELTPALVKIICAGGPAR